MTTAMRQPGLMDAQRRPAWARAGAVCAAWVAAMLASTALDRGAYLLLGLQDEAARRVLESADWYRLLRVMGSLWTWGGVAAVLLLIDHARVSAGASIRGGWTRRGVVLFVSAVLSGGAAELIKGLIGRMRPENTEGWYAFMPVADRLGWNWSDLGLPSSHAAVAFGAAFALSFAHRAAAPVLVLAAAGCGLTRVVMEQHFVSDIVAGAAVAYAVSLAVWRVDARNNGGVGLGEAAAGVWGPGAVGGESRPTRGSAAP